MAIEITLQGGDPHTVTVTRQATRAIVTVDGRDHRAAPGAVGAGDELVVGTRSERVWAVTAGDTVWVHAFGRAWELSLFDTEERALAVQASEDVALAPMPGTVISVGVQAGQAGHAGEQLMVSESMKMQSEIVAVRDGVVERVLLNVGDTFDRGATLVSLVADGDSQED